MKNISNFLKWATTTKGRHRVLFIILISCLNFLCYLLLSRNMTYLYGSQTSITFTSQPFLFFLFIIKIGLAGFSLSLLLHERLKQKGILPGTNRLLWAVGLLILLFNLVNYFVMQSQWLVFIVTFSLAFGTSFIFGLLFVEAIKPLDLQYNKSLFYLLLTLLSTPDTHLLMALLLKRDKYS